MSSTRSSIRVAAGQLDPTQFADCEELASTAAGFAVVAIVIYLIGRLSLVPGMMRLVSARNRNSPMLQSAVETHAHAVIIDTLISGLFLVVGPDFSVGDWISWLGDEDVVGAVDFQATRAWTVNNGTTSMPNAELTTNVLTHPYGRERYRLTGRVDIAYVDDAKLALRELVETAWEDDRVLDDPEPTTHIAEFAGSSVGPRMEFWVGLPMDANLVDVCLQYRRYAKRRFDEEGLTLGPASSRKVSGRFDMDLVGGRDGE